MLPDVSEDTNVIVEVLASVEERPVQILSDEKLAIKFIQGPWCGFHIMATP